MLPGAPGHLSHKQKEQTNVLRQTHQTLNPFSETQAEQWDRVGGAMEALYQGRVVSDWLLFFSYFLGLVERGQGGICEREPFCS